MNCAKIAELTRWECVPSGISSVRATAPLTFGDSGHRIAFFIAQPSETTFYLSDACENAIYAEQLGISLTKSRLETLNRTVGVELAEFATDWSIEASGPIEELQAALWDAVKLALALSFKSNAWRPRFAQARFQAVVVQEFEAQIGAERIVKQARVQGASGHTIEFPFGIKRASGGLVYVQPVALDNGKVSWPAIYEFHGKLFDVKAASEIENRIAIIESGASALEFGRAAHFLSAAASVATLDDVPRLVRAFFPA